MKTTLRLCLLTLALYLANTSAVRAEKLVLVAGGGTGADGVPATQAKLVTPFGVDFDRAGNLYFVEYSGQRVGKIDGKGILTTIAGTGEKGGDGDDGPARKARFNTLHGLAVAPSGDIYLADTENFRVRKIDAQTGVVTTVAGTGEKGFSGDDGPAVKARFGGIYSVALDPRGEQLYVTDLDNHRVRAVNLKTGVVVTAAGNGQRGVPEDGADAHTAPLFDPRAAIVDAAGNLFILERSGNALRVVDANGKIRTVAGTGKKGPADDGDARQATLNDPKHLCIDRAGNVLIADSNNHMVRRYEPKTGKIVGVAGTGQRGSAGLGGPPLKAELNQPHGVYVHPTGAVYIADSSNQRILKIEQ